MAAAGSPWNRWSRTGPWCCGRTTLELRSGRSVDPSGPLPRAYADGVWSFNLWPAPGGQTLHCLRTRVGAQA